MENSNIKVFLRVLYTVNSNPQYILAKSSSQVPAIACSTTAAGIATDEPTYARASLKACLAAVCDSSPELLQDYSRDFSLYVLDPLEAQPLPANLEHASHSTNSPRGVAVALGLMSRALETNDSTNVLVTGTLIPNASPALEVIFALRETKRLPRPMLYPSFGLMSPSDPSQTPYPLHPSQAPETTWPSAPNLRHYRQEQQTLTRSADFPELYIGPPRRAPGRPEGSTSSKSKVKAQASTSSLPVASSSQVAETQSDSKQEIGQKSKRKSKTRPPRALPTSSPFTFGPLTRQTTSGSSEAGSTGGSALHQQSYSFGQDRTQVHPQPQTQPHSHSARNPLVELLSAISPSLTGTAANVTLEQQSALLSALQGLLATNPQLLQPAASNKVLPTSGGQQTAENRPAREGSTDEHDDTDSDIVILDSSSIDTTVFRKPSLKQPAARVDQESPMPNSQSTDLSPLLACKPLRDEKTPTVTTISEAKNPTSRHASSGQTERGNVTPSRMLDIPATPTPSRTHKRKLDEYIQGQARSPILSSPPSPSPSMMRTSGSGRTFITKQRILSSPTGGSKPASSPSVRLPSMLNAMRNMGTSGPRPRVSSSGSSMHGHQGSLTTKKSGSQPATLVSGPSESKVGHLETKVGSSSIVSDATPLKRRLNISLNEFMEECEARRDEKTRKRPSLGRKPGAGTSANVSRVIPSHAFKAVTTSRNAKSSPPRPLFRSDQVTSSLPASTCPPPLVPCVSNTVRTTPASTARSTSTMTAAPKNNALKNFVMPAWARTSTAMLPRLSEEALARQQAEREAMKAQASIRRRESAKAKRKRLRDAERYRESSDEGDETVSNDPGPQSLHPTTVVRSAPSLPPLSLPVFASDAVEAIPSSPARPHGQLGGGATPSTPPKKPASPTSALHHSPSKTGSCSLFTPSGQDRGSLFTPSTPSATRSLARVAFTPRSPSVRRRSSTSESPRKNVPQTPKRNGTNHQTPRSLQGGRNVTFASPGFTTRTHQAQSMGTRAFLLPPPSPCTLRTPIADDQESNELQDIASNGDASQSGVEFTSSPLPPSSPLPASPLSSPARRHDSDFDTSTVNDLVPDPDVLLPSASDFKGPQGIVDAAWLSDDACAASWFADSEASAWFSETEAWLTDTEGGPLLTDSDGAWLSDSDGVFGDMSSLPPSSTSNWFSDGADVKPDEDRIIEIGDVELDTAALEKAIAALVGRNVGGKDESSDTGSHDTKLAESEFWESVRPLLEEGASSKTGVEAEYVGDAVTKGKVAQGIQELLDGLVRSSP